MRHNILDRAIGWIWPRAGLARHFDRQRLTRAYDAASPRDLWKPRRGSASANADHQADATKLREKSRALRQNVAYVASAFEGLSSHTVGTGIVPRSTGREAELVNKTLTEWMAICDADGRFDFNGLVNAAYLAMEGDGEVLVRLRPRLASDGLPVPLQLQLLEIDWIDSTRTQAIGANRVINGIEYDYLGRVVAYWLWENHPGDVNSFSALRTQSRRIDAAQIIHLYRPERPGQGRGFPRISPVIGRIRDLQLYEDAELARKNLETRLSVLYSGDPAAIGNPAAGSLNTDPAAIAQTGMLGDLPSGSINSLPAGSEITVVEPKPAGGYVEYVSQQLHMIAAGIGVPYEMMTGDLSGVNFSSARVRRLDFRRSVEAMQSVILVPRLIIPIFKAFVDAGVLGGQFRVRDYSMDYSTPKWDYVNPQQDVQADIDLVSVGLSSISELLRQRGYDPDTVFAEIASDFDKLKKLGVMDILLFKETSKPADGADPSKTAAAAQDAARTHAEALAEARVLLQRLSEDVAQLMTREPVINVTTGATNVEVPERSVTNNLNVAPAEAKVEIRNEAPQVHVDNRVDPTPVNVQVAAPDVRVTNHVETPVVNVTTPKRESITDIELDEKGRIKRTRKREL